MSMKNFIGREGHLGKLNALHGFLFPSMYAKTHLFKCELTRWRLVL